MNGSNGHGDEDGDGDAVLGPACPKAGDVWDALQVLRDFMSISLNGKDIQSSTHLQ